MSKSWLGLALMAVLLLAACAVRPTSYQAVGEASRYGYSDEQIDARTWRVRFAGNSATDRGRVEDYLLYRAAEIAVAAGADGFVVLKEDVEKDVAYQGSTHYPGGAFHYGHFRGGSHIGVGVGFGTTSLQPIKRYTGHATVRLFRQLAPEDLGPAYDARAILRVLGPKIERPPADTA